MGGWALACSPHLYAFSRWEGGTKRRVRGTQAGKRKRLVSLYYEMLGKVRLPRQSGLHPILVEEVFCPQAEESFEAWLVSLMNFYDGSELSDFVDNIFRTDQVQQFL